MANSSNHFKPTAYVNSAQLTWYRRILSQHTYAVSLAIGRISKTPFATLLTILVIGLALALPTGVLLVLSSSQALINKLDNGTQISLFIESTMTTAEVQQLEQQLSHDQRVAKVRYIAPSEVMRSFQSALGIRENAHSMEESFLPGILEIVPAYQKYKSEQIAQFVEELKQLPGIEVAQLDIDWINRLQAIMNIIEQAALLLLILVSTGVMLIIANTIRLIQELYRDELEIMRLIGANNSFVRRPFVYTGLLYGIFGGLVAWLILDFFLVYLRQPLQDLLNLYMNQASVSELDFQTLIILTMIGAVFGLIGSLISVFVFSLKQENEIICL